MEEKEESVPDPIHQLILDPFLLSLVMGKRRGRVIERTYHRVSKKDSMNTLDRPPCNSLARWQRTPAKNVYEQQPTCLCKSWRIVFNTSGSIYLSHCTWYLCKNDHGSIQSLFCARPKHPNGFLFSLRRLSLGRMEKERTLTYRGAESTISRIYQRLNHR